MENGQLPESAVSRSAMSKVFWRILPLIALAYLFAYMDRVNVSFAAAQMNDDLKFSATIGGGGLSGPCLFEILSNMCPVGGQWVTTDTGACLCCGGGGGGLSALPVLVPWRARGASAEGWIQWLAREQARTRRCDTMCWLRSPIRACS
ncbi:MAG: hypothetical protein IPP45_08865 [Sphingomonadales bacterium]|nr:hypothetical protein [Sphingomonadales bacterium]